MAMLNNQMVSNVSQVVSLPGFSATVSRPEASCASSSSRVARANWEKRTPGQWAAKAQMIWAFSR